jgi:hypothetical protein
LLVTFGVVLEDAWVSSQQVRRDHPAGPVGDHHALTDPINMAMVFLPL